MRVANCSKCRRVFKRMNSPLCPDCREAAANRLSTVYRFVQENVDMTLEQVSEHCDVPLRELESMFFSGKLGSATRNIAYRCQGCGQSLTILMGGGRFCRNCTDHIESALGYEKPEYRPRTVRRIDPHPEVVLDDIVPKAEEEPIIDEPVTPASNPVNYGFKRVSD